MPYVQIDTNLWAVMLYPKGRPAAMILGVANRDNLPLFLVQQWHPELSERRVISQHGTVEEANASVLWDLEKVSTPPGAREWAHPTAPTPHKPQIALCPPAPPSRRVAGTQGVSVLWLILWRIGLASALTWGVITCDFEVSSLMISEWCATGCSTLAPEGQCSLREKPSRTLHRLFKE